MEFIVTVETKFAGHSLGSKEIMRIYRDDFEVGAEDIGLSLEEGKDALYALQQEVVTDQVTVISAASSVCEHCDETRQKQDLRPRLIRTAFGQVRASCFRYQVCPCRPSRHKYIWPMRWLRNDTTTPVFRYLMARWGSLLPYRQAATLLREFLPLTGDELSYSTVRRHTMNVGERMDSIAREPEEYELSTKDDRLKPKPAGRLIVAIDGTYVRATQRWFERHHFILAGRVERNGVLEGRLAWAAANPQTAADLMRTTLLAHGLTSNTHVAVLADGADGLKNLVRGAVEQDVRSVLDWFHISMRLRPMEQMRHTVAGSIADPKASTEFNRLLPNLRHQMWNGKFNDARRRMRKLFDLCLDDPLERSNAKSKRLARFRKHLLDMQDYLSNNRDGLTNYAHAQRSGLRISSAPAESNMHHIVNQRMCKRQPMRWTAYGAHRLLQVRCAVLDGRLAESFSRWYPRFRLAPDRTEEYYM